MLSKRSIRKNVDIFLNDKGIEKETLIELSVDYTEKEISTLKKLIKQGGRIKLHGDIIEFKRNDDRIRNSKGEFEPLNIKPSSLSDFDF